MTLAVQASTSGLGFDGGGAEWSRDVATTERARTEPTSDDREYIVHFTAPARVDIEGRRLRDHLNQDERPTVSVVRSTGTGALVIRLPKGLDSISETVLLHKVAQDHGVTWVESNQPTGNAFFTPSTPGFVDFQWNLQGRVTGGIRADRAWNHADGEAVTVAVLDTGIVPHAALTTVLPGYDFISDPIAAADGDGRDGNPRDEDTQGRYPGSAVECPSDWHGTAVAGVVAGSVTSGNAAGGAFRARILPLRVSTQACGAGFRPADLADAIIYASGGHIDGVPDNMFPAKVINISLGRYTPSPCWREVQQAVGIARERGSIVVVAAGNSGQNAEDYAPANCAGTVSVAAINASGARAIFSGGGSSNFGVPPYVDLAAPGNDVFVITNKSPTAYLAGLDGYTYADGTSIAAPHVSAVAALILSELPRLTPAEVEDILVKTVGRPCSDCMANRVDADAAIRRVTGPQFRYNGHYANYTTTQIFPSRLVSSAIVVEPWDSQPTSRRFLQTVRVQISYPRPADLSLDLQGVLADGSVKLYRLRPATTAPDPYQPYVPTDYVIVDGPDLATITATVTWKLRVRNSASTSLFPAAITGWNMWL